MHWADRFLTSLAALSVATFVAAPGFAHINLVDPPPRIHGLASGEGVKTRDCGQPTNARTTTATTYAPGETITVTIEETVNHDSYYRVSLNPNGDTFQYRPTGVSVAPEPLATALAAEEAVDTNGYLLGVFPDNNTTNNARLNFTVTLPNQECTNCTLQVVQYMYNRTDPFYYQCADLVISAGGEGTPGPDAGAPTGSGGSANTGGGGAPPLGNGGSATAPSGQGGAGPTGVNPPASGGAAPTGTGGSGTAGSGASAGTGGLIIPPKSDDDDSGCAMAPQRSTSFAGIGALALLALGAASRRRKR